MFNYYEDEKADIYGLLIEDFSRYFDGVTAEDVVDDPYIIGQRIADEMFNSDSVTGNASGSYYCNAWKAKEAVIDNIELLREAFESFGDSAEHIANMFLCEDWESMDVIIRCYLLFPLMDEIMEDIRDAVEGIADREEMVDAYKIAEALAA